VGKFPNSLCGKKCPGGVTSVKRGCEFAKLSTVSKAKLGKAAKMVNTEASIPNKNFSIEIIELRVLTSKVSTKLTLPAPVNVFL